MFCVRLVLLVLAFLPTASICSSDCVLFVVLYKVSWQLSAFYIWYSFLLFFFFPSMYIMLIQALTSWLQGQFLSAMLKYRENLILISSAFHAWITHRDLLCILKIWMPPLCYPSSNFTRNWQKNCFMEVKSLVTMWFYCWVLWATAQVFRFNLRERFTPCVICHDF